MRLVASLLKRAFTLAQDLKDLRQRHLVAILIAAGLFGGVFMAVSPLAQASRAEPGGEPVCITWTSGRDCTAQTVYRSIAGLQPGQQQDLQVAVTALLGPYADDRQVPAAPEVLSIVEQDLTAPSPELFACVQQALLGSVSRAARANALTDTVGAAFTGAGQVLGHLPVGPSGSLAASILKGGGGLIDGVGVFADQAEARALSTVLVGCAAW